MLVLLTVCTRGCEIEEVAGERGSTRMGYGVKRWVCYWSLIGTNRLSRGSEAGRIKKVGSPAKGIHFINIMVRAEKMEKGLMVKLSPTKLLRQKGHTDERTKA